MNNLKECFTIMKAITTRKITLKMYDFMSRNTMYVRFYVMLCVCKVYCLKSHIINPLLRLVIKTKVVVFLFDQGPMLETFDFTIRIGSTPTLLYFDL